MKKVVVLFFVFISLSGCVSMLTEPSQMMPKEAQRRFTFDYRVDGVTKSELWRRARDYFAGAFGDSRSVFRVMDEKDGTLIGKGTSSSWLYTIGSVFLLCESAYSIRFAAKDNKARLQMEIIDGAPPTSKCQGLPLPTIEGYEQMKLSFMGASKDLKEALEGKGASSDLKDF